MLISANYGMHRSIVEGNLIARKAVLPAGPDRLLPGITSATAGGPQRQRDRFRQRTG